MIINFHVTVLFALIATFHNFPVSAWIQSRVLLLDSVPLNITLEALAKSRVSKQALYRQLDLMLESKSQVVADAPSETVVFDPSINNNKVIMLECTSNYPATWIYEGPSDGPGMQILANTRREFTNLSDTSTYRFVATAKLLHPNERSTGKYTCRSLMMPKMKQSFFIFVPGLEFFVVDKHEAVGYIKDGSMTVPCPISYPYPERSNLTLELYKMDAESGHPERILNATFDSMYGFERQIYELDDPDQVWGEYVCTCGNSSYTNSITVNVKPPPDTRAKATIAGYFVPLHESIKQMFVCEGKQNVSFMYSSEWSLDSYLKIPKLSKMTFFYQAGAEFPFVSTLQANPREFKDFALIHCVAAGIDGRLQKHSLSHMILHTWEYSALGNNKNMKFTYNDDMEALICCTVDSSATPKIEVLPSCETFQECLLRYPFRDGETQLLASDVSMPANKELTVSDAFTFLIASGLNKSKDKIEFYSSNFEFYADNYTTSAKKVLPPHCAAKKRYSSDKFAIIRCSVPTQPGIFHKFPSQEFIYADSKGEHVLSMADLANTEGVIQLEAFHGIQRIVAGRTLQIRAGDELVVKCVPNGFLFSREKYLALQRNHGPIEVLPKVRNQKILTVDGRISPHENLDVVLIPDDDVTAIYCFAPLWYSLEWRNASIEVIIA